MENMRDVLKRSLGRSLAGMDPLDRLAAAWPVVCGASMARRGELVGYDDGVLAISVPDPIWMQQMIDLRSQLTRELARVAQVPVREIHFHLGRSRP